MGNELLLYGVLRRNVMEKLHGEENTSRIAILAELPRLRRF